MGAGTGVWVHDVCDRQRVHEKQPIRVAVCGEQVQAAEGGWDGIGDGELNYGSQYVDVQESGISTY